MENLNQNSLVNANNPNPPQKEDKTPGILSYVFLIGWIIAYVMMNDASKTKKTEFNLYHLRQAIGVHIFSIIISVFTQLISFPFSGLLNLVPIIFMILGLVAASSGEKKPLPLLGEQPQEWFKSIK